MSEPTAAHRPEKALAMLREHAASLDPDSFVSEVIRVLEGEDEAPTAATASELRPLRIAYADPPYPGCAHLYKDHPDYGGEVDHIELARVLSHYDGWCLHTSSVAQFHVQEALFKMGLRPSDPLTGIKGDYRVFAWVKPFAAFKRNVPVAYAWEPVLVKECRKPVVKPGMTYRDWIAEPITLKKGLTGAKPEAVCRWVFECMGCQPQDTLDDLFPGTGAVMDAWEAWRAQLPLEFVA